MSHGSAVKTAWGVFGFLVFALPIAVFGAWAAFEKDKTIPQWLAERGYSVTQIVVPYAICAAVVSILFYLTLIAYSKRSERPNLTGEIICLEMDPRLDTKDNDYDCFITLCVKVRNKGTPTAVDTFSLNLWWQGVDHQGLDEPLDGYVVETVGREPGDWGEPRRKTRTTPLYGFPMSQEITTTSETGWLRFSFGALPPEMIDRGHLARAVIIELTIKDSQETSHTIYKGTLYDGVVSRLAGCGKIVKYPF